MGTIFFFELLTTLTPKDADCIPTDVCLFSTLDKLHILGLFEVYDDLADRFLLLEGLQKAMSILLTGPRSLLREFGGFFVTLLHQAKLNIDNLSTIRKLAIPPPFATLRTMVERASGVVDNLHYFVWKSDFFKWYIFQYQSQTIRKRYIELRRPFYSAPKSECDVAEAAPFADYQPSLTEDSDDGGDEAEVKKISTEYEILEDNLKSLHLDRGPPHIAYNWLRLVISGRGSRYRSTFMKRGLSIRCQREIIPLKTR